MIFTRARHLAWTYTWVKLQTKTKASVNRRKKNHKGRSESQVGILIGFCWVDSRNVEWLQPMPGSLTADMNHWSDHAAAAVLSTRSSNATEHWILEATVNSASFTCFLYANRSEFVRTFGSSSWGIITHLNLQSSQGCSVWNPDPSPRLKVGLWLQFHNCIQSSCSAVLYSAEPAEKWARMLFLITT